MYQSRERITICSAFSQLSSHNGNDNDEFMGELQREREKFSSCMYVSKRFHNNCERGEEHMVTCLGDPFFAQFQLLTFLFKGFAIPFRAELYEKKMKFRLCGLRRRRRKSERARESEVKFILLWSWVDESCHGAVSIVLQKNLLLLNDNSEHWKRAFSARTRCDVRRAEGGRRWRYETSELRLDESEFAYISLSRMWWWRNVWKSPCLEFIDSICSSATSVCYFIGKGHNSEFQFDVSGYSPCLPRLEEGNRRRGKKRPKVRLSFQIQQNFLVSFPSQYTIFNSFRPTSLSFRTCSTNNKYNYRRFHQFKPFWEMSKQKLRRNFR